MTAKRPGLKKRVPRPAPVVQRELHQAMRKHNLEFFNVPEVEGAHQWRILTAEELRRPTLMDAFAARVRSLGSRLLRFRAPKKPRA